MNEGAYAINAKIQEITRRSYSVETTRKWPKRYGMPVEKVFGRIAISDDDLKAWLSSKTHRV